MKINIYWILSLLYMVLIFILSSYTIPIKTPSFSFFDKTAHIVEYGILASLIHLALRDRNVTKHKLFALAFMIAFLYGVSDEVHQYFVPGRNADIFDVLANGVGAFCFLTLIQILSYQRSVFSFQLLKTIKNNHENAKARKNERTKKRLISHRVR